LACPATSGAHLYDEQNVLGLPSLNEGDPQLKKIPLITLLFVPVRTI
jgi:hypothetical protein